MIVSLTAILLAQLAGEVAARAIALPLPGPVIGMALMLAFLALRDRGASVSRRVLPQPLHDGTLESTGRGLLTHLSLMFVPAGVGVVGRLDVLAAQGSKLAIVLIVSVIIALSATALTFVAVSRLVARGSAADRAGGSE